MALSAIPRNGTKCLTSIGHLLRNRIVLQHISPCFIIFFSFLSTISDILCNFALALLTPSRLHKMSERLQGGSTTLWNASLTLCFWLFETTTIELVVEDIAEVDATGRYIPSRWCADG